MSKALIVTPKKNYGIKYVSFCGGGAKAITHAGVLQSLYERNLYDEIEGWSGSSAGGIYALAGSLKLNPIDVVKHIRKMNVAELFGSSSNPIQKYLNIYGKGLLSLFRSYGFFDNKVGKNLIRDFFIDFGFNPDMTFEEHYKLTKSTLAITASCIYSNKIVVFSYWSYPFIKVADALKASVCYPIIFKPVKFKDPTFGSNRCLIDGGTFANEPFYIFDLYDNSVERELMAINNQVMNVTIKTEKPIEATDIKSYGMNLCSSLNTTLMKRHIDCLYDERTIRIPISDVGTFDTDLNKEKIIYLFRTGYENAEKFLEKRLEGGKMTMCFAKPFSKNDEKGMFIPNYKSLYLGKKFTDDDKYKMLLYETNPDNFI